MISHTEEKIIGVQLLLKEKNYYSSSSSSALPELMNYYSLSPFCSTPFSVGFFNHTVLFFSTYIWCQLSSQVIQMMNCTVSQQPLKKEEHVSTTSYLHFVPRLFHSLFFIAVLYYPAHMWWQVIRLRMEEPVFPASAVLHVRRWLWQSAIVSAETQFSSCPGRGMTKNKMFPTHVQDCMCTRRCQAGTSMARRKCQMFTGRRLINIHDFVANAIQLSLINRAMQVLRKQNKWS